MTEVTKHEPGSFSWAELATSDPQGAKEFYSGLFGWSIKDNPMGPSADDIYTLLQISGQDVAALYKMMKEQAAQGVPPNWMCYVTVEDADETAKKAKSLGATVITEPFDVMDYGRMAVIQDPEGAIFSIWQPMKHIGVRRVEEPNTMCWCELQTRDAAKAGKFYTNLFGWSLKTSDPAYHEIMRRRRRIGGIPHDCRDGGGASALGHLFPGHGLRRGCVEGDLARREGLRSTDRHPENGPFFACRTLKERFSTSSSSTFNPLDAPPLPLML